MEIISYPEKVTLAIHLISDIHHEFLKNIVDVKVPYIINYNEKIKTVCILAGDIGHPHKKLYGDFISDLKKKFNYVIVIAGNHEYYSTKEQKYTMEQIENQIEYICDKYGAFFLNKSTIIIENVKFIGCTLWSFITDSIKTMANMKMNDY